MKTEIETFLQKNMTRKDFLRHIGLLILSVIGVTNVLKYLAGNAGIDTHVKRSGGYGSSPYGGEKNHL